MAPQSHRSGRNSNQFASGYTFTGGTAPRMVLEPTTRTVVRTTLPLTLRAVATEVPSRPQNPRNHCTHPAARAITTRQLMKAKCRTNANQAVGVTVELVEPGTGGRSLVAERGDVVAFHLFCGSAENAHNTNSTGRSDRSRYCRSGSLQISTLVAGGDLGVKGRHPQHRRTAPIGLGVPTCEAGHAHCGRESRETANDSVLLEGSAHRYPGCVRRHR